MKHLLSGLWKLAQVACVAVVLLIAILAVSIAPSKERLRGAYAALQGRRTEGPPPPRTGIEEEWRKLEESRAKAEESQRRREEELRRLQDLSAVELARLDQERKRLELARKDAEKARADAKKERDELEKKKIDQVTESNLTIFEEMKGQEVATIMTGWTDPEIVRYLRLLSPEKAAQVLRAMQADGSPYRTLPPDAPKGTTTRLERLVPMLQQ